MCTLPKRILLDNRKYVILPIWEIHRAKGGFAPLIFSEGFKQPSRRKKGGRCNVCYISGFNPDWNTHCCPCEFDLSDLQGKKEIAATIRSSDGKPRMR